MSTDGVYYYDPTEVADQFDATANLGPPIAGYMAQLYLFGIFASRFYRYLLSKHYRNDSRANRAFLWLVAVLLSGTTGLNIFSLLWHGCWQNRSLQSIYMVEVPDALTAPFSGSVGAVVQWFLVLRASRLFRHSSARRYTFLGGMLVLIVLTWLASLMITATTLSFTYNFQEAIAPINFSIIGAVWCSTSAAVDLAISLSLFFNLRGSVAGFNKTTDSAVRRIMRLAIQTAAPTAALQLVSAVLAVAFGNTSAEYSVVWLAFNGPLASIYALSLVLTLGSRKPVKRHRAVVGSTSWLGGSGQPGGDKRRSQSQAGRPSLARRTISKMSIPQIVAPHARAPSADPTASASVSGITFTRDVVEEVEAVEELPSARRGRRPERRRPSYDQNYLELPKPFSG